MNKDQGRQLLDRVTALEQRLAAHERVSVLILTSESYRAMAVDARNMALKAIHDLAIPKDDQAAASLAVEVASQVRERTRQRSQFEST